MVKYFIFAMLTGFVVCFQNCADKEFSVRTDLNKSTSLDGTEELIADDVSQSDSDSDDITNVGTAPSAPNGGDRGGSRSPGSSVNNNYDEEDKVGEIDKDGKICMRHGVKMRTTDVGVCILEGNGKSQHVALINDSIVSNNSTPKTVCMSALACRKIVDEKFKVVSLEKRGFCNNGSAHTVLLTDAQVRSLIDQIEE
jgi:hypothetical protein